MIPHSIVRAASEKVAATRAVKNVRKALNTGNLEEANRLAKLYGGAGALKDSPAGTQAQRLEDPYKGLRSAYFSPLPGHSPFSQALIKLRNTTSNMEMEGRRVPREMKLLQQRLEKRDAPGIERVFARIDRRNPQGQAYLGGEGEGHVTKIIDPKGIGARKSYYIQGDLSFPQLRKDARDYLQDMAGHPQVPKFFGAYEGPMGPMLKTEFIGGRPPTPEESLDPKSHFQRAVQKLTADSKKKGWIIQDLANNPPNSVITPAGRTVAVDPMAMPVSRFKADPNIGRVGFGNTILDAYAPTGKFHGVAESLDTQLRRLGPGSRQAPKVPGAKPATPGLEALKQRYRDRPTPLTPMTMPSYANTAASASQPNPRPSPTTDIFGSGPKTSVFGAK